MVNKMSDLHKSLQSRTCDRGMISHKDIKDQIPYLMSRARQKRLNLPFYSAQDLLDLGCNAINIGSRKIQLVIGIPLVHPRAKYDLYSNYFPPAYDKKSDRYFSFSNTEELIIVQEKSPQTLYRKFNSFSKEQLKALVALPKGRFLYPGAISAYTDLPHKVVKSPASCTYYLRYLNDEKALQVCDMQVFEHVPIVTIITPTVLAFGKFESGDDVATLECRKYNPPRIEQQRFKLQHRFVHVNNGDCEFLHAEFDLFLPGSMNSVYEDEVEYTEYSEEIVEYSRRIKRTRQTEKWLKTTDLTIN